MSYQFIQEFVAVSLFKHKIRITLLMLLLCLFFLSFFLYYCFFYCYVSSRLVMVMGRVEGGIMIPESELDLEAILEPTLYPKKF